MRFTPRSEIPPAVFLSDPVEVAQMCERYSKMDCPIGFDTETSGLEFDGLLVDAYLVGLCTTDHRCAIQTYESGSRENLQILDKFLRETQSRHCGWNIQYDWNVMYGYTKYGFGWSRPIDLDTCYADGMKLYCLFDEEGEDTYGNRRLKDRARHWLGLPMNDFDSIAHKMGFRWALSENRELAIDYATRDAWAHMGLCMLGKQVTEQMPWCMACPECGSFCYEQSTRKREQWRCLQHGWVSDGEPLTMWDWHVKRDIPFLKLLQKMQIRGTPMDWGYLEESVQPLEMALEQKRRDFYRIIGDAFHEMHGIRRPFNINLNSHDQLRELYHGTVDRDGVPCGFGFRASDKTDTGNSSMGKKSLQKLMAVQQAPGVLELLEFRKLDKILSTYVRGILNRRFPFDDYLHGIFRPWTTTGRLLSRDPNMQNFPTKDVLVWLPPAAPYVPTVEEMVADWGATEEEAELELQDPQYQGREMVVNIRKAVKAPKGMKILCADYSQLEIRLTAHESGCEALISVLKDGLDMHCYAAAQAFKIAIPDVGYDEIFEAKAWDDGDTSARHATLASLAGEGSVDHIVSSRLKGLLPSEKPSAVDTLRSVGSMRLLWDGTPEGFGAFLQNSNAEMYLRACDILGTRDRELLNLRKSAKSAIFGIIYGIGPTGLAVQITEATRKPCTVKEARDLIMSIRDVVFPGIGKMINRQKHTLKTKGYVRTGMLRYRHPAGVFSGDHGKRARAERQASNSPIQGLAADVVMAAMLAIEADAQMNEWGCILFSQVHDELLVLAPDEFADVALERLKLLMEISHGVDTPVPLTATGHAADTWDEAK